MEKLLGRTEADFLKAKSNSERMSQALLKKYPWVKNIRFKGDIGFRSSRKKLDIERDIAKGKEVSFGLNQEMVYEDFKGNFQKTDIIFRFKELPFYEVYLKSYKRKPTIEDLIEQLKDTWIILGSGNVPEEPKAMIIFKAEMLPRQCFVPVLEYKKVVKFKINFAKWIRWVPNHQADIFGNNLVDEMFKKIRKGEGT